MKKATLTILTLTMLAGTIFAAGPGPLVKLADGQSGYHPDVGDSVRIVKGKDYKFPYNFGPTGLTGWFYEREFVVNGLDAGSPADGVLKIGDRIRAVNGRRLPMPSFTDDMNDPRRIMGMGITESETSERDGKLTVTVWRTGKEVDLTIKLAVMPAYSPTWPYDCQKSERILGEACEWLAKNQLPNGSFVEDRSDGYALGPALNGMLLLSSGEPKYLENARRLAHHFAANPGANPFKGAQTGTDLWGWSYEAVFIAEYYLRTGDTHVLPYLGWLHKVIMASRGPRGGWSHGFKMAAYAVGGYINPNAVSSLTALGLIEHAGFEMKTDLYEQSKFYVRRWSYGGRGIHYGDHKSELATEPHDSFGAGKNALATVTFDILGEPDASKRFAQTVIDTYRRRDGCHAGPFFALAWGPIAASRTTPEEFKMFQDYWTWFHDLSRRWDGSFLMPSTNGGGGYAARGPVFTMGGQAMVYALPKKITRLCGATDSPFSVKGMPRALKPIAAMVGQKQYRQAAASLDRLCKIARLDAKTVARATLMQQSLATTLESIEITYAGIESDIGAGEIVRARTRVGNLEHLLGRTDKRLAALKAKAFAPATDKIVAAWKTYLTHRMTCRSDPASYKVIQGQAADATIGFVQGRAKQSLIAAERWPTYEDNFCSESIMKMHRAGFDADNNDPTHLGVMRLLAFGDGILWTSWVPRKWLQEKGLLGEFPFSTPLAATSAKSPAAWKYLQSDTDAASAGWNTPGFDDSGWKQVAAPLRSPGRTAPEPNQVWTKPHLLMRRAFTVKTVDFDALRIKALVNDAIDIYLNGRHVARMLKERRHATEYIDFDITSAALPALKIGRNVLAIKAVRSGGHIDIGLLGVKR